MTGLDKIIAEIKGEAEAEARQTVDAARAEADEILAAARAEAEAKAERIAAAARQDIADIERSRESAMALQRSQRSLAQKQALLAETLNKARESLYALGDGEYFDLLLRLAAKNAEPGEGEVLLNEKDKKRLPKDFEARLAAALPKGSTLKLAGEARAIDGGFVLRYGQVEENCSFGAMFDAREEEFSDLIRPSLFGE